MKGLRSRFTDLYLVWLLGAAAAALVRPAVLAWFQGPWVVGALSIVMLGMGLTLKPADFGQLFRMPGSLAVGFLAHYTLMPISGWCISKVLDLPRPLALGLILLASCPSGTASNVVSFLAGANVALAVLVTLSSTLFAFVMTPLWCLLLAGAQVPVDPFKLGLSTLQVAVMPVLLGVFVNWKFPRQAARIARLGPPVSVVAIVFITGGIVALNSEAILENAARLVIASVLLHGTGFGAGYLVGRFLGYSEQVARTISIEVGMQNGGLAAVLARRNFPTEPLAAVPAVFSGVIQNIVGSLLAQYWRRRPVPPKGLRQDVYYWKCDRPAAFHGTQARTTGGPQIARELQGALEAHFGTPPLDLRPGAGQGNHLTWEASLDGQPVFVRVENGPEGDTHLGVESVVLERVRKTGVPTPRVLGCDSSRTKAAFAWQVLEKIEFPDLNHWHTAGTLNLPRVAFEIGRAVATWQEIQPTGFGVLDESLNGCRRSYPDYFFLRLDEHLQFLRRADFITAGQRKDFEAVLEANRGVLELEQGCLVHKDLALWNVLGGPDSIAAFIDFDDAISGDPTEDLSLLGCFHDARFLVEALQGYTSVRPRPVDFERRFWVHLLRNMIVKAVIRVGAGYFERKDSFFLLGRGMEGVQLRDFTRQRLESALGALREGGGFERLGNA